MSQQHEDRCGVDCPQCQAFSEQARVLGGLGEAMQKMLDDGTFERLGADMARRQEEAFLRAFVGEDKP